jgi:hypothetical protein
MSWKRQNKKKKGRGITVTIKEQKLVKLFLLHYVNLEKEKCILYRQTDILVDVK